MPDPKTIDELADLSWEAFEAFATNVLKRYYDSYHLELIPTPLQHDGGRDAEATYVFGASPRKDRRSLAAFFKLWVEVKQIKTNDRVGLARIGKNFVRAVIEEVSKIIVVTNTGYTRGLSRDVEEFARRVGIDYCLLTGEDLVALAEQLGSPDKQIGSASHSGISSKRKQIDLELNCFLSSDPLSLFEELPNSFSGVPGSPIFIIADLKIRHAPRPVHISIEATPKLPHIGDIFAYSRSREMVVAKHKDPHLPIPLTCGDRRRHSFVVFPYGRSPVSINDFNIRPVVRSRGLRLTQKVNSFGEYKITAPILSDWVPPSRQKVLTALGSEIQEWLLSQETRAKVLLAKAGTGKSHAVAHLRRQWLSQGAFEVYLDGGLQSTDLGIMDRIFQQIFPIEPRSLAEDQSESIEKWLQLAGMSPHRASEVAIAVCQRRELRHLDVRYLGEVMASLLRRTASFMPVVLLLEDLHKCQPSALALLNEAYRYLRSSQAHVLLFMTSREHSSSGVPEERRAWSSSFDNLPEEFRVTEIHNPTRQEAAQLILKTIPVLEPHYAEKVIEQVGRSPFGIREALQLLRVSDVIIFDRKLKAWRIPHPELLYRTIESEDLKRSTQLRLSRFLEKHSDWLRTFIEAGACLGRFFPVDLCLTLANQEDGSFVRTVLGKCEEADLIRPSPVNPSDYVFDHDLIRSALLANMEGRQRWIAGQLWTILEPTASHSLLGNLAYQAGYAERSVEHTMAAAVESTGRFRYADAVRSLLLVLQVLDPNPYGLSGHLAEDNLLQVDEAIRSASPPLLSGYPRSEIRRRVLPVITMLINSLVEIGQIGSDLAARSISEGILLARSQGDAHALADLELATGLHKFALGQIEESLKHHEKAEEIYNTLDLSLQAKRVPNLVRLAISLRQAGRKEQSLAILQKADATRNSNDFVSAVRILQNCGALYFYSDLSRVREYWSSALCASEKSGAPERIVHCLIDLAILDILEDNLRQARSGLDQALRTAEEFGLEESCIRALLHTACVDIIESEPRVARMRLLEAEKMALEIRAFRDLWRIRANLATAYELLGDLDRSYAQDATSIADIRLLLVASPANSDKLKRFGREILPFVNVALRQGRSSLHGELFTDLEPSLRKAALGLANYVEEGRLEELPNLLWKHCKTVGENLRFVITD
jgi:hypothetical protein